MGGTVGVVVVHQLFPSSRECLPSRKKCIVQMMRQTGVEVVVVVGREERRMGGRGATV